jgi:protein TonB
MKQRINRDKAAGITAALVLHAVVLYGLWSYHIIPPPSEVLTVFVANLNMPSQVKTAEPVVPKPAPTVPEKQETPRPDAPLTPQVLTSPVPAVSPSEPLVPLPPVAKVAPAVVATRPANVAVPNQMPAAASQPVQLTGELSISCPERPGPAYPKLSARFGEQGKAILLVELDELGRVINASVKTTSGFPRLDEAAISAVKNWHCTPARRNGAAVRAVALQPFNFTLKGR